MRSELDADRVRSLMTAIGRAALGPGRIYLTGGTSAVLVGWRGATIDADLKLDPEPAGIFEALRRIKDELDVNVELASPDDFIPPLPGWRERSLYIASCGPVEFYHYDFYGQALAKLERGHERDLSDVREMLARGLVERAGLLEHLAAIEPSLLRYPALDADAFRRKVEHFVAEGPLG